MTAHHVGSATISFGGKPFMSTLAEFGEPAFVHDGPVSGLGEAIERYTATGSMTLTRNGHRLFIEAVNEYDRAQREHARRAQELRTLVRRQFYPGGRKARSAVRRLRRIGFYR